jgi:hypothetical protein
MSQLPILAQHQHSPHCPLKNHNDETYSCASSPSHCTHHVCCHTPHLAHCTIVPSSNSVLHTHRTALESSGGGANSSSAGRDASSEDSKIAFTSDRISLTKRLKFSCSTTCYVQENNRRVSALHQQCGQIRGKLAVSSPRATNARTSQLAIVCGNTFRGRSA